MAFWETMMFQTAIAIFGCKSSQGDKIVGFLSGVDSKMIKRSGTSRNQVSRARNPIEAHTEVQPSGLGQ